MRDFASFLDEMVPAQPDGDVPSDAGATLDPDAASPSMPYAFVGGSEIDEAPTDGGSSASAKAYLGLDMGWITPESLPETAPELIARELALERLADVKSLDRLRREFAFRNHPDRMKAEWRDSAMARMQVANRLIDEAKQRLARSGR